MKFMIEVEIKTSISDPEFIRKELERYGAKYICSLIHEDTYYNLPLNLRDFGETDEALRIRDSIKFNKMNKEEIHSYNSYIAYKGKKLDMETKTRKELELKIDDSEKLREIFSILGFREVLTIKKERELFKLIYKNYTLELLIDYVPLLKKYFLEIEYISKDQKDINDVKSLLFEFLKLLKIQRGDSITKSYLELIIDSLS